MMLARAGASRRATTTAALAARKIGSRPAPLSSRPLSFLPWRKKPPSDLPVYFPKAPASAHGGRKPWRRTRRVVLTLAVYYVLWQVYMSVVLDPLLDWAENEWESLTPQERQEMEKEAEEEGVEAQIFLPFPFTTKEVKQPPYRGSDPEWKQFVSLSRDETKQKEIRHQLAEMLRKRIESNPNLARSMGGKIILRRYWLDIVYPAAPPAKHFVSGLIIDSEGVFWGDRQIDTAAAKYISAIVYPKAVALAVWTFWNVYVKLMKDEVSKALGFEGTNQQNPLWPPVTVGRPNERAPFGDAAGKPTGINVIPPPDTPGKAATSPGSPTSILDINGLFRKQAEGDMSASPTMAGALQAASHTLRKNWQHVQHPPTSDCVLVDGIVELQGERAIMSMSVSSWYDTKLKKYTSAQVSVRHLLPKNQKPLGGQAKGT